ncbi:MAG: CaiB/BaiF CoA-transferase family protein [Pseudomonadota bacterium]
MRGPLTGVRVVDLSTVLAGPFCTHQLCHLGAEVIKVETPGSGDLARQLGSDRALNEAGMGISFLAQNAGKRSITLNLKTDDGAAAFRKLVATADVVVENFRPGVMERLGLGYETLCEIKPELIYCAISGFGQEGSWIKRPAYDQIIQGLSGLMTMTGDAQSAPLRVGFPMADTVGGLTAAFAVSSALNARPRGSFIDVSMLASLMSMLGWAVSNFLISGNAPVPQGNFNPAASPSGVFEASDGPFNIAANSDAMWELLTEHLGLSELRNRPEYKTRDDRKANRRALKAELEVVLSTRPAQVWSEQLNALGVPSGPVLTLPGILSEPPVRERSFVTTYDAVPGVDAPVSVATTGVHMDGQGFSVDAPPAVLGQHTDEVLAELGYSADEITKLRGQGVL